MFLKSVSFAAAFGAAMLGAGAANATTIYEDKGAWETAAGGIVVNTTSDATLPLGSYITDISLADGSTITTTDIVAVEKIASGWATWSGGYLGNVYEPIGNEISINLSGFSAFGLEIEPNKPSNFNITVSLSDGSSITDLVNGSGGAQFFGWVAANIDKVTISTTDTQFAFGNIYSVRTVQTPEPLTLALVGAGLAGIGAMRRRKQV